MPYVKRLVNNQLSFLETQETEKPEKTQNVIEGHKAEIRKHIALNYSIMENLSEIMKNNEEDYSLIDITNMAKKSVDALKTLIGLERQALNIKQKEFVDDVDMMTDIELDSAHAIFNEKEKTV